jgi:hypothetical protein
MADVSDYQLMAAMASGNTQDRQRQHGDSERAANTKRLSTMQRRALACWPDIRAADPCPIAKGSSWLPKLSLSNCHYPCSLDARRDM